MSNFFFGLLKTLKLPLKLLVQKRKTFKKNQKEHQLRTYIYNFSPSRLKNRSWQVSLGKDKPKKRKKRLTKNPKC